MKTPYIIKRRRGQLSPPRTLSPLSFSQTKLWLAPADVAQQTIRGHALFAGGDNYLQRADNALFNVGANFSCSCWLRMTGVSTLDRSILGQFPHDTSDTNVAWALATGGSAGEGDELRVLWGNAATGVTAGNRVTAANPLLAAGVWHHIVLTFGSSTFLLYVDGVAKTLQGGSGTFPATIYNSTGIFGLGHAFHSSWDGFTGALSDVCLFSTTLDATQVGYLYGAGYGNYFSSGAWQTNDAGLPDPIAFWACDESASSRADSSGNALTLSEVASPIAGAKHTITANDQSASGLQFGAPSTDRRKTAMDYLADGINNTPCWEGAPTRFLCAHYTKNTWMAQSSGDILFIFKQVTAPAAGEELLIFSSSHEDEGLVPDAANDNHIGVLATSGGEMNFRYKGDGLVYDSGYPSDTSGDVDAGDIFLVNWHFPGDGTHQLRLNGVNITTTDGGQGRGNFFDKGTLRTNVGLNVIRRLLSGSISNDTGSGGTRRLGEIVVCGPALTLTDNRRLEAWLANRAGIALP